MKRMRGNQVSDIADMTITKLIFFSLHSERVALYADYSAKSQVFVAELFWRVEIVLALLGKHLNFFTHFEVAFDVLDYGQIVQGSRFDPVEDVDLDEFVLLDFDVDRVNALAVHTLDNADHR
jgi:hypothetical protein